jgi:phage terminase large subunit
MSSQIQRLTNFKPLWQKPTRYTIITGGRGSFKSHHTGLFLVDLTKETGHTILSTRYTLTSAHISVIPEFTSKIRLQEDNGYIQKGCFDITKTDVVNKITGSNILFKGIHTTSGNQTANLKSIEGLTTFVLDEAEELDDEEDFDTIDLSVRKKDKDNRVIMIMNPSNRQHWIYKRFFERPGVAFDFNGKIDDVTYIFSCYLDKPSFLHESFLKTAQKTKEFNLAKYNHLFLGHWREDSEKTLWKRKNIKYKEAPQIIKAIVAVDPAITSRPESDETGILVIGKATDGLLYVLDDLSGRFTPAEWAGRAVSAYEKYGAHKIIYEDNQGGDMVKNTITSVSKAVMVDSVHASKGKFTRAEPVAAYYEQGMVFHTRVFTDLEFQMTTWLPDDKISPDRMDALVWGVTYFINEEQKSGIIYAN